MIECTVLNLHAELFCNLVLVTPTIFEHRLAKIVLFFISSLLEFVQVLYDGIVVKQSD